jgi:hypothetical protein
MRRKLFFLFSWVTTFGAFGFLLGAGISMVIGDLVSTKTGSYFWVGIASCILAVTAIVFNCILYNLFEELYKAESEL